MGGGIFAGLIIITAVFSKAPLFRYIAWSYLALYLGTIAIFVTIDKVPKEALIAPVVWSLLLFIALEVKRGFGPNQEMKEKS